MITIKNTVTYGTTDGMEFDTEQGAIDHERASLIRVELIRRGYPDAASWTLAEIIRDTFPAMAQIMDAPLRPVDSKTALMDMIDRRRAEKDRQAQERADGPVFVPNADSAYDGL